MFQRLLLQWFWDTYDALWRLVILNVLLGIVLSALFFFGLLPAGRLALILAESNPALGALAGLLAWTLGGALFLTLWLPGLLRIASIVSQDREARLADYFHGLKEAKWRFFRMALVVCFGLGVILLNMFFYARWTSSGQGAVRALGAGLAGICLWAALLGIGVAAHAFPLSLNKNLPFRTSLRLAVLIVLRHPVFTLAAILFLGLLWFVSCVVLKTAPIWVIGLSATATWLNSMHDVVIRREEEAQAKAAEAEEAAGAAADRREDAPFAPQKPSSWRQIQALQSKEDEKKNDRYARSLRDLLKPWEYH